MSRPKRAADLGIKIGRFAPGPHDAISDVAGVRVAATTIVRGDGELRRGEGPVRTGVTAILPRAAGEMGRPLFAGTHRLNGNGELTGLEWIRESGFLTTPICLTNTHSVGVVHDEMIRWSLDNVPGAPPWSLPVVGETWDGVLNDVNGFHVTAAHARAALDAAASLPVGAAVPRGNVGGGTGMICHGFKGGSGTASRRLPAELGGWTVGVFVQANHGRRHRLTIAGHNLGAEGGPFAVDRYPLPYPAAAAATVSSALGASSADDPRGGAGSIIVIVATDAPLIATQLDRVAQRAVMGIARVGGVGEHSSGDLVLSFSTANPQLPVENLEPARPFTTSVEMVVNAHLSPLFEATVDATEAAIVDALLAGETMVGVNGATALELPVDVLAAALR
ncbi:MAG: P1 family peptidase [Candidatus Limnocylindrus sp.]|jgi:D-aminopeptidase